MARKSISGTVKTPAEIKRAMALREAGFSLACIANKTGISTATLARHFKRHGIGKGGLSAKAIKEAKQELVEDGFVDSLKAEVTSSILDDVAQYKALRAALAINIDELLNDDTLAPHYRSRGLTAAATGLRLSQELVRKALQIDSIEPDQKELPTLTISELTQADMEQIRAEQTIDPLYNKPNIEPSDNAIVEES